MVETERICPESTGSVQQMLSGVETSWAKLDSRSRQQEAVLAFGRRANARPPMSVLMQDAVTIVKEVIEADLGGVGLVVSNGTAPILNLTIASREGGGEAAEPAVHNSLLDATDSMATYALKDASSVQVEDLPSEQRCTDHFLLRLGVRGALTVPLHLNQEPFGTLGVYSKQLRKFTRDEVRFAETIAYQLISSIVQTKAENELQRQRQFISKLLDSVDAIVLELDAEGKLTDMNRASRDLTGFSVEEVRQKHFCNVFVVPKEIELLQEVLRSVAKEKSPRRFESSLLTKDGTQRSISWSLSVLCDRERTLQAIVLAGTDRTELVQMQEDLERTRARAGKTGDALEELRKEKETERDQTAMSESKPGDAPADGQADRPSTPPDAASGLQGIEQRSSPRQSYQYQQLIAPVYGGSIPSRKSFFEVTCEDISAGGIAFLLDQRPDFKDLVVALGQDSGVKYLSARVARVVEKQRDGKTTYMVGCQFSGRVYL